MIRPEEIETHGEGWERQADYTGQPSFFHHEGWYTIEVGLIERTATRRDGAAVFGYHLPYVMLTIRQHNWGRMLDVTEAQAVKLIKGRGRDALDAYRNEFDAGEAELMAKRETAGIMKGVYRPPPPGRPLDFQPDPPAPDGKAAASSAQQTFAAMFFNRRPDSGGEE